ncbi:metallophosphoesterase family protein [Peredibacter sp. HCB2-198]|uniref:metallophosphoesterase family protein n=1 Tax=Peredibacter sp. HCB2-198 TaxID=3383025 RepID=UPI0038B4B38A
MSDNMNRRDFLTYAGAGAALATLPVNLVKLAFGGTQEDFTFAFISDAHIQHISGTKFVRNWDQGLKMAVAEANLMHPKPDFVIFGGDLAQLALKEELDHGAEIMSALKYKTYWVMGEHDYYLDYGKYWEKLFGPQWYSFDHKGVHFVVLNSILTYDEWNKKWPTDMERMVQMAGLDNPKGSPFMVGKEQREWLKKDLAKVSKSTPIVVLSHSPLQKIFRGWNFWTEDADEVQAILKPFRKVTVLYGHVHQIQYNQIGNISFHAAMATAWPWPYPSTYVKAEQHLPVLTVPMNRADPFFERDATGWQYINIHTGNVAAHYQLPNNTNRVVSFNKKTGRPEDTTYQNKANRVLPQEHY